jgi:hypothetical protein
MNENALTVAIRVRPQITDSQTYLAVCTPQNFALSSKYLGKKLF